jgi:hypothetical protein
LQGFSFGMGDFYVVYVEGVFHCLVLRILQLQHLSETEVFEHSSDGAHGVAVAGYGYVARFLFEPMLELRYEGQGSVFHHLEAFAFGWGKIVSSVDFGEPFGFFFGDFDFAFSL